MKYTVLAAAIAMMGFGQTMNFNARPGLWEVTTVSSGPGYDTSRLPPEMRAKMEEALKKQAAAAEKPHVNRSCMTKEKMQKDMFMDDRASSCKRTIVTNTHNTLEVKLECPNEKMPITGVFHMEALSRESVKGTMKMTGAMNMNTNISAKWISDNCGDVK